MINKNNKISNGVRKGFSLVESLMVISLVTVVVSAFAFVNNTAKSKAVLDKAQTNVIAALKEARNRSATGFSTTKHGVHIEEDKIVLFEGDSYTGQGVETDLPFSVSTDKTGLTLVFDRLNPALNISNDVSIVLKHISGLEKTITITKEGNIGYE